MKNDRQLFTLSVHCFSSQSENNIEMHVWRLRRFCFTDSWLLFRLDMKRSAPNEPPSSFWATHTVSFEANMRNFGLKTLWLLGSVRVRLETHFGLGLTRTNLVSSCLRRLFSPGFQTQIRRFSAVPQVCSGSVILFCFAVCVCFKSLVLLFFLSFPQLLILSFSLLFHLGLSISSLSSLLPALCHSPSSPPHLLLTVGQVCKMPEHFTQWYPFTARSAHNDFKLSVMAHNRHFYPTPADISMCTFFIRQKLCVCMFCICTHPNSVQISNIYINILHVKTSPCMRNIYI